MSLSHESNKKDGEKNKRKADEQLSPDMVRKICENRPKK